MGEIYICVKQCNPHLSYSVAVLTYILFLNVCKTNFFLSVLGGLPTFPTLEERVEADSRSIFVGNVCYKFTYC